VIIKSTNGNVFGGYTEQNWSPHHLYKTDPNAFLFSFINQHNTKIIMKCTDPSYAIYARRGYGPTFGGSHDIHVADNSNANTNSYVNNNSDNCYNVPKAASGYPILTDGNYEF
jgi:hypothetical protein